MMCNPAESGHSFRTNPDTEYGPIRTGGRLKADTSKWPRGWTVPWSTKAGTWPS
jgi:hypothetical protein